MSLLTTWSDRNKRTTHALSISYSVGEYNEEQLDAWFPITRLAAKQYEYVGMTRDAACLCLASKRIQYTRPAVYGADAGANRVDLNPAGYYPPGYPLSQRYSARLMGDIAMQQDGSSGAWSVVLSLREEETVWALVRWASLNPVAIFDSFLGGFAAGDYCVMLPHSSRPYDEDFDRAALTIRNVAIESIDDAYATLSLEYYATPELREAGYGADGRIPANYVPLIAYYSANDSAFVPTRCSTANVSLPGAGDMLLGQWASASVTLDLTTLAVGDRIAPRGVQLTLSTLGNGSRVTERFLQSGLAAHGVSNTVWLPIDLEGIL